MGWEPWPWPFIAAPSVPSIVVWGLAKIGGGVVDAPPPPTAGTGVELIEDVLLNCVLEIAATRARPWATAMPRQWMHELEQMGRE